MLDLSKLTPAPWTVKRDEESATHFVAKPSGFPLLLSELEDEEGIAALAFAALARNAFDVMMRRGWEPVRLIDKEHWAVYWPQTDGGKWCVAPLMMQWLDPYTALVEADKWHTANIEVKHVDATT